MNSSYISTNETEDCFVIGRNATVPWDNPDNLLSLEMRQLVEAVKCVILIPILYIIGAPGNITNMVVFFKQGLNERINLCPFLLAMVDLIFLTFLLIYRTSSIYAPFTNSGQLGTAYMYMLNNNVLGLYGLGYMSMLISTVIATERCVCVLFPLRAQRCVGTKLFACVLMTSMCVVGFSRFVVTAKYIAACYYEVRTARISWKLSSSEYFFQNRNMLNILDGILYGFCLSVGCPLITLITTIITAVKLHQVVRWRDGKSSAMSNKEIGVTKMLICLSIEFIILSTPFITLRILPMFDPELSPGGKYANMFAVLISLADLSSYISSSVNFFVYYIAGSRYRQTLHSLLNWKKTSSFRPDDHTKINR